MNQFVDALLLLLPGAEVTRCKQQPWHSATFAGERVTLELSLTGEDAAERAGRLAAELPEFEFSLAQGFVAEILVCDIIQCPAGADLTIEALLVFD
jgi:hypothetical protein